MNGAESLSYLKALVVHPPDQDQETIVRQLRRSGCHVEAMWPPPNVIPESIDLVYFLIDEHTSHALPWSGTRPTFAIVAILQQGAASLARLVVDSTPHAVLNKPVNESDVLTSLFVARSLFRYEERLHTKVRKLEETLRSIRKVEKAKSILISSKKIGEKEAYEFLRKSAMKQRVPIGKIAAAVIEASDIFSQQDRF